MHVNEVAHKQKAVNAQSLKISPFMSESREFDVIKAEVMFTNFIIDFANSLRHWTFFWAKANQPAIVIWRGRQLREVDKPYVDQLRKCI